MAIFQSRTNYNDASVDGGTEDFNVRGTLYFPRNHVKLIGGSDSLGIEVVAWTLTIGGNGPLRINYDGRNKTVPHRSYLVW